MLSLHVGCVCVLVNEVEDDAALDIVTEKLSGASVGKDKAMRKRPDNNWSGSDEETLKETTQKINEDECRTLRAHKEEKGKKRKSALRKEKADSSSS